MIPQEVLESRKFYLNQLPTVSDENQRHLERYKKFILSRSHTDIHIFPSGRFRMIKEHNVHHIFPKSLGGDNHKKNLIALSYREHYVAHMILAKCGYSKMIYAFIMLCNSTKANSSKVFEALSMQCSKLRSERMKGKNNPSVKNPKRGERNGMFGKSVSQETRDKLAKASKNRTFSHSEEAKRKMSESHKGKKASNEAKENMSKASKGKPKSESHRRKIGESNKGKKKGSQSQQTKDKISIAITGDKNGFFGKKHSEETKLSWSNKRKGRRWIHNILTNHQLQVDIREIERYISLGYTFGMLSKTVR